MQENAFKISSAKWRPFCAGEDEFRKVVSLVLLSARMLSIACPDGGRVNITVSQQWHRSLQYKYYELINNDPEYKPTRHHVINNHHADLTMTSVSHESYYDMSYFR